jgi:tetratricopeptide (TPR) repeat protein
LTSQAQDAAVADPGAAGVALHDQALAAVDGGRFAAAADLCRRAVDLLTEDGGPDHPDVANVLSLLGSAEDELGAHGDAEEHHRRALAILVAFIEDDAPEGVLLRLLVQARVGLAGCLRRQGRYAAAEEAYRQALTEAAREFREPELAPICNELGILYKFGGRLDEAERWYHRALSALSAEYGPDHPELASLHHNLAGLAHSRGDTALAEEYARRSVAMRRAALPADHPTVVADEAHLGAILEAAGKLAEAEPLLRRAVDFFGRAYGSEHYEVAVNLHNLAAVRARLGALAEAEMLYLQALAGKRAVLGPQHPEVGLTMYNLSVLALELGQPERARGLAAGAHEVLAASVAPGHPARLAAREHLAALGD